MSMSDCQDCWETPCACGWDYRNWSIARLENQIYMLSKVIEFKKANPTIKFGGGFGKRTEDDIKFKKFMIISEQSRQSKKVV